MNIILASASPRRRELLSLLIPDFTVLTAAADESTSETSPAAMVMDISRKKALAVAPLADGDIIIAAVDGEFTVKEFRRDDDNKGGWLIPHNPDFQPIRVDKNNEFSVWGVVTYAIHKTRL